MREVRKQLEMLLIDYFRNNYDEFPHGKMLPSESPDFIVKMKSRHLLGIELTRLNPGNAADPNHKTLTEIEFRDGLILFTKEVFERHSDMKLFVKFLFSENRKLMPELEMITAVHVSNLIRGIVRNRKAGTFFKELIHQKNLPDGLDQILVVHHPKLETAVWERSNNLGISNDVVDDIRKSILKKDDKLRLYQKQQLNYYWLLITTDTLRGIRSYNLSNQIMNHKFHSRFQHVFLFDLVRSKVYELV